MANHVDPDQTAPTLFAKAFFFRTFGAQSFRTFTILILSLSADDKPMLDHLTSGKNISKCVLLEFLSSMLSINGHAKRGFSIFL